MLNVLLDTTPLSNENKHRGVGVYTRFLSESLASNDRVQLFRSKSDIPKTQKIDVTHYPFFDLFFSTLPLIKKSKTVITIHDVIPLQFPQFYQPGKKGSLRLFRQTLVARNSEAIITDSEASKADIHKLLKIPTKKIHVIPLAANPELRKLDAPAAHAIRTALNVPEKYILYVGDINYNKNLPQLIKALKYIPEDIRLVCVGKNFRPHDVPEWQWIETQIALSDVAGRIQFLAELPAESNRELSALYSGATAYVQPSLYEGFGLPVLEAMQCRTPVVTTNVSSLPEVAGDHAVLVQPTSESLSEGINQVIEWSASKRERVIKDAYHWSQAFSWSKTAAATIDVYESLYRA